ncbi:MAG: SURF1 family protein [Betaproteobacteria bacterium]|nr:MAG: SURF1 family protein [Betaproteobacteria bacterium]
MLRGYSFRPRGWALAAAAAACAAFVLLGNWQARRAEQKRALGAELERALKLPPIQLAPAEVDTGTLLHKRVAARGRFVAERTVLLDNRLRRGRPGYEVVTPLALAGSEWHVLVNRGWIAAPPSRMVVPEVRTPADEQRVEGIALERLPHALQAGSAPTGRVRQNLDIGAFAAETGLRLQPLVIEQHSDADDGLARDWPRPDLGIERHESYALQWYLFAGLAIVLLAVLSVRRVPAP